MRVVISGYGAMGQTLLTELTSLEDIELCGVVSPLGEFGHQSFRELPKVPEVIIDFSHPDNLNDLIDYAVSNKVALVIATTNMSNNQEEQIKEASNFVPILYTGNTSLGINVLNEVVKTLTNVLTDFDIEIIEKHHNKKVDAPSGTAKMFLNTIQEERKVTPIYGRNGISKRNENEVTVHAVRGGTIPGEHTIIFAGEDEVIEVKHSALSKRIFTRGAVTAARFINEQKSGLYSMKDIF